MAFKAEIQADIKNFQANLAKASQSMQSFQEKISGGTKRVDASLKQTGTQMRALSSVAKQAGAVIASAFAFTAVIRGLRSFISTNVDFEQSLANLSSMTGAVGDDLEYYKKQAIEMGAVTTLSASQVSEAFMLIGSAQPQLLKSKEALAQVTKESITLAEAAGMQLPDAARALTGAMNQFKISADSASEVINVLAAGSKEGSADINSLNQSLTNVGTVAFSAGLSIQQTVGALETLAENQIKGSEAGTALRGVIMRLQASGLGYASGVFSLSDALKEAKESIESHTTAVEKDARSQEIFGIINTTAGKIMMDNVDTYHRLTDAVTGTSTAYEQQATNTNTLKASFLALSSAIEGIVLSFSESNGIIKSVVDSLVAMLNNVRENIDVYKRWGKVLISIGATFATVAIAMKAVTIATTAMRVATIILSGKFALLNTVMMANPFVAVAAAVVGLTVYLVDLWRKMDKVDDATKAAADATKVFHEELAKEQREVDKLFDAYKLANPETDEHRKIKEQIIDKYGQFLQGQIDEKGNLIDIDSAYKQLNTSLRDQIALKIKNQRLEALDVKNITAQAKAISDLTEKVDQSDRVKFGTRLNEELREFSNSAEKDIDKLWGKLATITRDEFGVDLMKSDGFFGKNANDAIRTLVNSMKDAESQSQALDIAFAGIDAIDAIDAIDETADSVDNLGDSLDKLGGKSLIPEGSLKELSEKLKVLYEQLDNETTQSGRIKVTNLINELEKKVVRIKVGIEMANTNIEGSLKELSEKLKVLYEQLDNETTQSGRIKVSRLINELENKVVRIKVAIDFENELKPITSTDLGVSPIIDLSPQIDKMGADLDRMKAVFDEKNQEIDQGVQMMNQMLVGGFIGVFESLGNAIGSGENVLGALSKSIVGALGDMAIQVGALMIGFGKMAQSLYALIAGPMGGVVAVAAGAALIALGATAKAAVSGAMGSVGGGGYSGGGGGYQSSRVDAPMQQGEFQYRDSYSGIPSKIELVARGSDLGAVIDMNNNRRNRIG